MDKDQTPPTFAEALKGLQEVSKSYAPGIHGAVNVFAAAVARELADLADRVTALEQAQAEGRAAEAGAEGTDSTTA